MGQYDLIALLVSNGVGYEIACEMLLSEAFNLAAAFQRRRAIALMEISGAVRAAFHADKNEFEKFLGALDG